MEKLFLKDPYMETCQAKVVHLDGPNVELDKTNFYAFSGGQASDRGTIGKVAVKEAVKTGDKIIYTLESIPEFKEGDIVEVKIDMDYRKKLMALHSAAHVVYEFAKKFFGEKLIGSNITIDKARLDFVYDGSVGENLPQIEKEANDFIHERRTIKSYGDPEDETKRIWEIEDFARMPCGGTHPHKTSEIGAVKLKRKNIGKGKERIEITLY